MSDLSEALAQYDSGEAGPHQVSELAAAARSWQALVERVEAGGRIIVETPCEHGEVGAHPTKWMGEPCPGGSRVDVTEEVMG